jgi:hypothetical protein
MAQTLSQLENSEYAIRWIAALPHERAVAEAMLNKEHALPQHRHTNDDNIYTPTGLIVANVCFSREDVPRGTKIESCSPQSRKRLSFNGSLWNL